MLGIDGDDGRRHAADARQLRRVRVVVGHPRARRAGRHRGGRARDHPHRRRGADGERRAPTAGPVGDARCRSAASRSPRPGDGADLRAAGPGARAGSVRSRSRAHKLIVCRVGAQLYAYRSACPMCAQRARHRHRSTVRCCGARSAARPTTCPAPGRSLDGNTTHLDPLPLVEDGGEVRIAVAAAPMSDPLDVLQRIRQAPRAARARASAATCAASWSPTSTSTSSTPRAATSCAPAAGCWLLFTSNGAGGGKYRAVPDRYLYARRAVDRARELGRAADPGERGLLLLQLDAWTRWPRSTRARPAPPSRCCPLDAWDRLVADNEVLRIDGGRRRGPPRPPRRASTDDAYLVPIDACYELVGELRRLWKGFDGGTEARDAIDAFFDRLRGAGADDRPRHLRRLEPARPVRGGAHAAAAAAHRDARGRARARHGAQGADPHRAPAAPLLARGGGAAARAVRRGAAVGRVAASRSCGPTWPPPSPSSPAAPRSTCRCRAPTTSRWRRPSTSTRIGDGEIPLVLLFNGTMFSYRDGGLIVQPVAVARRGRAPAARRGVAGDDGRASSRTAAGSGCARETIDALTRYKADRALTSWEDAFERLLKEADEPMSVDPFEQAQRVADAVLWEGYVLYPYRASAAKNQVRWQYGVLTPRPLQRGRRLRALDDADRVPARVRPRGRAST